MNQSIYKGLYSPELSRIQEQIQQSKRSLKQSIYGIKQPSTILQNTQQEEQLNQIEAEIKKTGKQLEKLYYEMLSIPDKYSEEYLQKENSRNNLKKHIIDLDYQHKSVYARKTRKNHQQFNNQLSRNTKNSNKSTEQSRIYKNQIAQSRFQINKDHKQQQKMNSPNNKSDRNIQGNIVRQDQKLQQSARKLRIAQIEAEIAQESLIRSQAELLASQLAYLQQNYHYPSLLLDPYFPPYYGSLDHFLDLY